MSNPELSVKDVATQLAVTVASDRLHLEHLGQLKLHSGHHDKRFSLLTRQPGADDHYTGLSVNPTTIRCLPETREHLRIPPHIGQGWIAWRVNVRNIFSAARAQHGHHDQAVGYFWQEDGRWHTDARNIASPEELDGMAQEQTARARLLENIKAVGGRSIREYIPHLEPVTAGLYPGGEHAETFESGEIGELLNYSRQSTSGEHPVIVGFPLVSVLEKFALEQPRR